MGRQWKEVLWAHHRPLPLLSVTGVLGFASMRSRAPPPSRTPPLRQPAVPHLLTTAASCRLVHKMLPAFLLLRLCLVACSLS